MKAKPKHEGKSERLITGSLWGVLIALSAGLGPLMFGNEFKNLMTFSTAVSLPHITKDSLSLKSTCWKTFKNADYINDIFSKNNHHKQGRVLYKDSFLYDSDDVACGCDKASLEKDPYGGDNCREIYCNDFSDVFVSKCLFNNQFIVFCDFNSAALDSTSFVGCKFINCDFSNAIINRSVTFKDCIFIKCFFRNTRFFPTLEERLELNDCDLFQCDFFASNFDHTMLEWKSNYNVYYMHCRNTHIKDKLRQLGLQGDVKYMDAAEKKDLINYASERNQFTQYWLLGNFLNDYGTNPLKPLIPVIFLLPVFFFIYFRMSFQRCIFLTWNGSLKNKGPVSKYTTDINKFVKYSAAKRSEAILAFTIVSCFSFGFSLIKGLDFQTLISAFQKRNVVFCSEGSIKLITGIQSLLVFLCFTLSVIALF